MEEQIYLYLYVEDGKQCDLCNEMKIELFRCNLCHFVCCPKCFYCFNVAHYTCSCLLNRNQF